MITVCAVFCLKDLFIRHCWNLSLFLFVFVCLFRVFCYLCIILSIDLKKNTYDRNINYIFCDLIP